MADKQNKTIYVVIPLLIIIVCLFVWYAVLSHNYTVAYSDTSTWDLRRLSFENDNYRLDGPVEYIPDALLTPEGFLEREDEAVVGYPEDVSQYATSRIRILLPDDGYYTFFCRSIDYAQRLYVNGQWILDVGNPGETAETNVSNTGKITLTLQPINGVIEIIQQSSNFVHREGGGHSGWRVGTPELMRTSLSEDFRENIQLGCFLTLFIVHIILFLLLRTYRANLYFALFCLTWFLRIGVTGSKAFTVLYPWISWAAKFRIEYLTFPITAVLLISLLDALFPGILHRWFRYALYSVSLVIAALFLFADTVFISYALLWCEALYIPAIVYIIVRFVMKLRIVSPEQGMFLVGVGLFFYAAIHDMFYYNDILLFPIGDLSSISMLLLTFCEAAAVFIATVREVKNAKAQEQRLAFENAALKERARMTENLLTLQRDQYGRIAQNVEYLRAMRHDMRHQLAAIKGMLGAKDWRSALDYCEEMDGSISVNTEQLLCHNAVVNAMLQHYVAIAERAGIKTDILLTIPEKAGRVSDIDLCVIMGNLLENAVDACRYLQPGERFIRARSSINGIYLSLMVENSFDGLWQEESGVYLSRKLSDDGQPREGVGLSSVMAVCARYDGVAKIEINGTVWRSSALLDMKEPMESFSLA